MNGLPILHAAMRAVGVDPESDEYTDDEMERTKRALLSTAGMIDRALGYEHVATFKFTGKAQQEAAE